MPIFPNVPNVPGVPALSRSPLVVSASISLLVADLISLIGKFLAPQWGIFRDGLPVVIADNVVSVDYRQDWNVSDYPVEQGAFESYDKVQVPFDAKVRFSTGGSLADRQELLSSIAAIAGSLELFDVVTPEAIYTSVNITHYDYHRTSHKGLGLLVVDVWCVEVRVEAAATFTKSASGSATTNGGTVQPQPASATQAAKVPEVQ